LQYSDLHVQIKKEWQPVHLLDIEVKQKHILAKVEGYHEREDVAKLTNLDIAICKKQLADLEPGQYYWHQLIGMQVINTHKEHLGTVTDIMGTGANDVLVVEGEKRFLIPYLPGQYVIEVNEAQQTIVVDWDLDF
jgi:16S rRNA processing protein RimM